MGDKEKQEPGQRPEVVSRIPIPGKRSQEYVQLTDGKVERRCYAPHNPHYFMDELGGMHSIDLTASKSAVTSKGKQIQLQDQNVASVGRVTDGSKEKWLGIRPDVNQKLNTESLEFDLVSVEFDGAEVGYTSADLSIKNSRQRCRQLVPATNTVSSFRIEMKVHAKGLRVERNEELDEWWCYSKKTDEFRFRIRRPVIVDEEGRPFRPSPDVNSSDFIAHSLTENEDGTFTYVKESLPGFEKLGLPESYFVDADTYYAKTSDGMVYHEHATWSTCRTAATGTTAYDSDSYSQWALTANQKADNDYYIVRSFFIFDTSGASVVAAAVWKGTTYGSETPTSTGTRNITIMAGTQGASLATSDYDAFSGSAFGTYDWPNDQGQSKYVTLNSAGESHVNTSGDTKICVRDTYYDVDNDGTPTNDDYNWGIYFSDELGTSKDPYLSITEATAPTVTTQACSSTTSSQTTGNGNITATGGVNATRRGFCYMTGTSGDPDTSDSTAYDDGDYGAGAYTKDITGLSAGTAYRVRAYAVNSVGTSYGTTVDVTTDPVAPTVTTQACTSTTATGTTGNGNITATGGENATRRGFCFFEGSSGDPKMFELHSDEESATGDPAIASKTFTAVDCTGLTKSNGYLLIDLKCSSPSDIGANSIEIGSKTSADDEEWYTTIPGTISTSWQTFKLALSDFSTTGAELDVTDIKRIRVYAYSDGSAITIYWRNARVSIGDVEYSNGDYSTGAFTESITGLSSGTSHRVRAFAENSAGVGQGSTVTVLTKPAAPTGVSATDGTHTDKVTVTWTKSTGATGYKVYEGSNLLATLGDVATYDDEDAAAGTITPGTTVATDGTHTDKVALSLSGASVANGASRTYKVVATNATGDSADSSTDTGYRGTGSLTYQWQRSAAASDASYSNISGATASTYDDTAAPAGAITPGSAVATDGTHTDKVALGISGSSIADGEARYYKCVMDATGCTQQTSTANSGYRGTGSITYQWQRSAAASDASYSNISGATTASYDDTAAPAGVITPGTASATDGTHTDKVALSLSGQSVADGASRYYKCVMDATGCTQQTTATDSGYRTTGSLTYQWQESAADSDASYSNITGGTTASYDNIDAPAGVITPGTATATSGTYTDKVSLSISGQSVADGAGRYYKCVIDATGCSQQTSTADRGYRTTGSLTYQWQRSADDSDASYSDIVGATTASYDDTGAPAGTITPGTTVATDGTHIDKVALSLSGASVSNGAGRYYQCVLNATGCVEQTT